MTTHVVITKVPSIESGGNLAAAFGLVACVEQPNESNGWMGRYEQVDVTAMLVLRLPVFQLHEILVCDDDGREIGGAGRKPSKWDVETETFTNAYEAVAYVKAHS